MHMTVADAYFREVLDRLRENLDASTVDLWLGKARVTAFDGDTITIAAENEFKKNTVINRYLDRLEDGFETAAGKRLKVLINSRDELNEEENRIFSSASLPAVKPEEPKKDEAPSVFRGYTFENFVVGSSNKVAQSACLAVATNPVIRINPLFLYGPSGLGKTHLLFATVNEAKRQNQNINILYVTGEQFTNEIIDAITAKNTAEFRDKYRNTDMLLVDDIQFIAGKVVVQEEFFHTFDTLYKMQKQIVLTSDKPPKDINPLEERLKTRFEMGLIADIQPPETELRTAIFKQKTKTLGLNIPNDVLTYLAENIKSNVRQIEGAVKKLWAQSFITNEKITLKMAQNVLTDYFRECKPVITTETIFKQLEKRYGISKEEMTGKKRTADIVYVRHIAIYLIHESTDLSLKKIGRLFDRDHSTIISARDNVMKRMKSDTLFNKEITEIIEELENR
ncbi:MAG: chromosomal replication initiator protein DnaA [Eubacteriales bacterium]|nr:chromosomal replication initiator protein DnaA [Eubacteriales bacterium]